MKFISFLLIIKLLFSLTGCGLTTEEIPEAPESIEIFNPSTKDFYMVEEYYEKKYSDNKIDKILFIPEVGLTGEGYNEYYLTFDVIKPKDKRTVMINSFMLERIKDVQLDPINKNINQKVEFEKTRDPKLVSKQYTLIEEFLKNYKGKINKNSKLRLTVNVTIDDDGQSIHKKLVFNLKTEIRKTWSTEYSETK